MAAWTFPMARAKMVSDKLVVAHPNTLGAKIVNTVLNTVVTMTMDRDTLCPDK